MGHLSILLGIKYIKIKKFSPVWNFQIFQYLTKKYVLISFFGKVKILKFLVGFELMAYRFVVNHFMHCVTLLDNSEKEIIYKFILDLIVYFDKKCVKTKRCPISPHRKNLH